MLIAWRRLLRHVVDIRRNTAITSETGATKWTYNSSQSASLLVDPAAALNDAIMFKARTPGVDGNGISIRYTLSGSANAPLQFIVNGLAITVSMAMDSSGNPATTAKALIDAINQSSHLVSAFVAPGTDGSDLITAAFGPTNLAGGLDDAALFATGLRCNIQGGRGRLRHDDMGQVAGRLYKVFFGPEAVPLGLKQNDLIVMRTPPPGGQGTFRIVHTSQILMYGTEVLRCDVEQWVPEGTP